MSERNKPGIAVLASGAGSTVEAFIHASEAGFVDAEVGLVVSNNSSAGVCRRIERLNKQYGLDIQTMHASGITHPNGAGEKGDMTM